MSAPSEDERVPDGATLNEQHREQSGAAGDELAQAVDRHRDELDLPRDPADGEDATGREPADELADER